jgi:hypothetical protein
VNPAEREWLQKVYPEFFEARVDEVKDLAELIVQYNNILISGPKTKEDLYLLYRVEADPYLRGRLRSTIGAQNYVGEAVTPAFKKGIFNYSQHVRYDTAGRLIGADPLRNVDYHAVPNDVTYQPERATRQGAAGDHLRRLGDNA